MRWFLIDKSKVSRPTSGGYREWKVQLADEAKHQCVYCAIPEAKFGGIRNFHVDHFRPKKRFPAQLHEYDNLFFACAICNVFKSDDWPGDVGDSGAGVGYLKPSEVDYATVFSVSDHAVSGHNIASRYMIHKLYLNRPQLVLERREHAAHARAVQVATRINELVGKLLSESDFGAAEIAKAALASLTELSVAREVLRLSVPYKVDDVQRP